MDNILKIFNSQDELEIKQAFKDILIDQFRQDLENNEYYMFNPERLEEIIHDTLEEVVLEFKEEVKKKMMEYIGTIDIAKIIK